MDWKKMKVFTADMRKAELHRQAYDCWRTPFGDVMIPFFEWAAGFWAGRWRGS